MSYILYFNNVTVNWYEVSSNSIKCLLSIWHLETNLIYFRWSWVHRIDQSSRKCHRGRGGSCQNLSGIQWQLFRQKHPGQDHRSVQTKRRGTLWKIEPKMDKVDAQNVLSLLFRKVTRQKVKSIWSPLTMVMGCGWQCFTQTDLLNLIPPRCYCF